MLLSEDKYYKLLNGDLINKEYQYKVGHNQMKGDFWPVIGEDGGLHCYRGCTLLRVLYDFTEENALIAEVEIDPNEVYIEEGGIVKAPALFVHEPVPAATYLQNYTLDEIVAVNPVNVRFFAHLSLDQQRQIATRGYGIWRYIRNIDPALAAEFQAADQAAAAAVENLKRVAAQAAPAIANPLLKT